MAEIEIDLLEVENVEEKNIRTSEFLHILGIFEMELHVQGFIFTEDLLKALFSMDDLLNYYIFWVQKHISIKLVQRSTHTL